MVQIFAGRDPSGAVRYIEDVPTGSQCALSCLVCSSPLVAKKGAVKEWHFAHASGQQHPECLVGARNLVRAEALGWLREGGALPQVRNYGAQARAGEFQESVSWNTAILAVRWSQQEAPSATEALGWVELEKGRAAEVFMQVEGDPVPPPRQGDQGLLLLTLTLPLSGAFRSKGDLRTHVAQHLRAHWLHLPDLHGVLAAASERVRQCQEAIEQLRAHNRSMRPTWEGDALREPQIFDPREKLRSLRAAFAARQAQGDLEAPHAQPCEQEPEADAMDEAQLQAQAPGWAGNGMFCLRFRDGSMWLLYEAREAGWLLRPWQTEDGWDEALPPSVGHADALRGAYRLGQEFFAAYMRVGPYQSGVRNTRDLRELQREFAQLSEPL